MNIDLRTLAVVIVITNCLQALAIILQYVLSKTYKGIGWWALGCTSLALGFILLLFRDIESIKLISIFFANIMLLSGHILFYIGTVRFLGIKENRRLVILIFSFFLLSTFYAIYVNRNDNVRPVILYLSVALILILNAKNLFVNKIESIKASANFTAAVFFTYGFFFIFRSLIALTVAAIESVFIPELIQISAFFITIIAGSLSTFGFIIMVNQRLNADSREDKERFELIFESGPDAAIITRLHDGLIVSINEGFASLTGFTMDEMVGKTTADINLWSNSGGREQAISTILVNGCYKNYETVFRLKDGRMINTVISGRVINLQGEQHILTVIHDITERKYAEDKIKALLEEKELILKEVHHRIKNNMTTINSLLLLQAESLKEPAAAAALKDAGTRVRSMMVLYDKLYQSDDFQQVSASEYISTLVDEIVSYFPNSRSVSIDKKIDGFSLDLKRLQPLGIIINELLTNMMKHAFAGINDGVITVSALLKGNNLLFIIADNGIGLPESIDFKNSKGFGLMLVNMLAKQLDADLRIERANGTRFMMDLKV